MIDFDCLNTLDIDNSKKFIIVSENIKIINNYYDIETLLNYKIKRFIMKEYELLSLITFTSEHHNNLYNYYDKCKNRFNDVLVYNHNKVISDNYEYINASLIKNPLLKNNNKINFIATQLPLKSTIKEFYLMIIEREIKLIINLLPNSIEELKYLNANNLKQINLELLCLLTLNYSYYNIYNYVIQVLSYIIIINSKNESENFKHEFTIIQFFEWKDKSIPKKETYNELSEIFNICRKHLEKYSSEIIIHCLAGIGRTGTFISIYYAIYLIDYLINNKLLSGINIFGIVRGIREQRKNSVENYFQYKFIFKYINYYYKKIVNA